jgi:hypothetical protein
MATTFHDVWIQVENKIIETGYKLDMQEVRYFAFVSCFRMRSAISPWTLGRCVRTKIASGSALPKTEPCVT